jgi:hypothetical protein
LDILFNGGETCYVRKLLEKCEIQHLLDESTPRIPEVLMTGNQEYEGTDIESEVRAVLRVSVDRIVHDRLRKRSDDLIDWRIQLDKAFQSNLTRLGVEMGITNFFLQCALPILCSDLACKMNHSFGHGSLVRDIRGGDVEALLRMGDTNEVKECLRNRGVVTDTEALAAIDVEGLSASFDQLAHSICSCAVEARPMFPQYFVFTRLLQAAESKRNDFGTSAHPGMVKKDLVHYISCALRQIGWNIFPKFTASGKALPGRRFVHLIRESSGEQDISAGPARPAARLLNESTDTPARLELFIREYITEKRHHGQWTEQERRIIHVIAECIFDGGAPSRPHSDQQRKALALCAARYTLNLTPAEKKAIRKTYYQGWDMLEESLIPFWTQEFIVAGVRRCLFRMVNKAQPALVPCGTWPP